MVFKICTSERNIRIIGATLAIAACSMITVPGAIADTRPKALTLFAGPQAPAFRPEIGPFRRFNLAFSAARYTAG
jgi:hypothetical protein